MSCLLSYFMQRHQNISLLQRINIGHIRLSSYPAVLIRYVFLNNNNKIYIALW